MSMTHGLASLREPTNRPTSHQARRHLPHFLSARAQRGICRLPPRLRSVQLVARKSICSYKLYETGDAAHLVLNFGQYRGAPLAQIARMDPEYVHQLAHTAQRPEVRAAARQMVLALEEIAAHSARPARRARSSG